MSHEQGDNIAGWGVGALVSLVAQAAGWVSASSLAQEVLHTLVFGAVGGAAGYLGRRALQGIIEKTKRQTKKDEQ